MISSHTKGSCLSLCLLLLPGILLAETAYITNEFRVGLHEDKTLDSPIVKTIKSGSALEIIKREENYTYVSDAKGSTGWIDNSYLTDTPADSTLAKGLAVEKENLEKKLADANAQIKTLQVRNSPPRTNSSVLKKERDELQQQFNTERLKAGELQVQLAELRKRIGQDNENASLYKEIEQLQLDKKSLEIQMTAVLESNALPTDAIANNGKASVGGNWKRQLIYLAITVFIGFSLGIYMMDYFNRRKHSGLRI